MVSILFWNKRPRKELFQTALLMGQRPWVRTFSLDLQATFTPNSTQHPDSETRIHGSLGAKSYRRWTWPAPDPVRTRLDVKCHLHCSTYKAQEHSNPLHFHVKQFNAAGDCNVLWPSHRQYLLIEQKFRRNKAMGFEWQTTKHPLLTSMTLNYL